MDDIDVLLDQSDPVKALTPQERRAASLMIAASARDRRRAWYLRPLVVGGIAAVLVSGGGVAAAAATGVWDVWAQNDALATLHYDLPSGASCELRLGNVEGAPVDVDNAIRDALAGAQIYDSEVARAAASIGVAGDTATEDDAYQAGFNWAVNERIEQALSARGLNGQWQSFNGQGNCQ
ncbi:hypothetical protein ACF044_00055 [Microbacterium sp. NPDC016588]